MSLHPINDLNPVGISKDPGCLTSPLTLVAWWPGLEQAIIAANDFLDSVTIRPALLYGGPSTHWSLWLGPIDAAPTLLASSELPIAANAHARLGLVHFDDVVLGVHLATNKHVFVSTASGSYPVFDVSSSSELLESIHDEAARVLRYRGRLVYEGSGKDKFAEAMNTGMKGSSTRLRDLLGWVPKHTSVGEEMEMFVSAWKAHQ